MWLALTGLGIPHVLGLKVRRGRSSSIGFEGLQVKGGREHPQPYAFALLLPLSHFPRHGQWWPPLPSACSASRNQRTSITVLHRNAAAAALGCPAHRKAKKSIRLTSHTHLTSFTVTASLKHTSHGDNTHTCTSTPPSPAGLAAHLPRLIWLSHSALIHLHTTIGAYVPIAFTRFHRGQLR